jgi:hypothetical protein
LGVIPLHPQCEQEKWPCTSQMRVILFAGCKYSPHPFAFGCSTSGVELSIGKGVKHGLSQKASSPAPSPAQSVWHFRRAGERSGIRCRGRCRLRCASRHDRAVVQHRLGGRGGFGSGSVGYGLHRADARRVRRGRHAQRRLGHHGTEGAEHGGNSHAGFGALRTELVRHSHRFQPVPASSSRQSTRIQPWRRHHRLPRSVWTRCTSGGSRRQARVSPLPQPLCRRLRMITHSPVYE